MLLASSQWDPKLDVGPDLNQGAGAEIGETNPERVGLDLRTEEELVVDLWKNEKAAQEDPAAAMGLLPEGGLDIDAALDPAVAPRATGGIDRRAGHQGEPVILNIYCNHFFTNKIVY